MSLISECQLFGAHLFLLIKLKNSHLNHNQYRGEDIISFGLSYGCYTICGMRVQWWKPKGGMYESISLSEDMCELLFNE